MLYQLALKDGTKKPRDEPNFLKQSFKKAMKENQNLPIKQITSNNMTGKLLSFTYRSRSIIRDSQENSRNGNPK